MEALLIDEWLRGLDTLYVLDEASLAVVRDRIHRLAASSGASAAVADRAALVATELGQNQLRHAGATGRIALTAIARGEHRGLEITAADRGPGIGDVAAVLDAAPRAAGSLGVGVGVGAVRRLSSEVDIDVRLGEGTCVRARVFDADAPRRREIGIYGRAHEDESISGDHASFARVDGALVLAVCDGLGHGPPAREASSLAMQAFHPSAFDAPAAVLSACDAALGNTRGVVMAVVRIDETASILEAASIGNVEVQLCAPRRSRRFGGSSSVLGGRHRGAAKVHTDRALIAPGDLVILSTDGITSRLAIEEDLALLREPPIVVAQRVLERFGRFNDDALVLVAR